MRECLPQDLWESLLQYLSVTTVVDLTPGPTLAKASLSSAISYFGVCKNAKFHEWLLSEVDNAALRSPDFRYN